jgi:hypothetical protein
MRNTPGAKFFPRIINPVKITKTVIFSAEEAVRKAEAALVENMPWMECRVFADPQSVSDYQSDQATVFLLDDTSLSFIDAKKIHKNNRNAVIVLLSSNDLIHRSPPSVAVEKFPFTALADLIFAVNSKEFFPDRIVTSVVRSAEDLLNIEKYSQARRYIFLIVDDEPRCFSEFLPVLYNIIGQRADVKVTRTYEETLEFIFGVRSEGQIDPDNYLASGHGDDVVCLITDVFFPKGEDLLSKAGVDLIRLMNLYYPRIPAIIASKAKEAEDLNEPVFILPKGDPGSIETLRTYINDFTGIGDFLVKDEKRGILYRAKHIRELYKIVKRAEKDTVGGQNLRELLEDYGRKDLFSTWLYMHGFRELADRLRPLQVTGKKMIAVLEKNLKEEIQRIEKIPLVIDGVEIFGLTDLIERLRRASPVKIQKLSDTDAFSNWLDLKCYPELAKKLRPIHGSGEKLRQTLVDLVEDWLAANQSD